jgi:hypothetical protein
MARQKYSVFTPTYVRSAKMFREVLREDKKRVRDLFGKPLKKVTPDELEREVWPYLMEAIRGKEVMLQANTPCMDGAVLMEEWCWKKDGAHVYFPMPGLLESLYTAKIDIEADDFLPPRRSFTIAVPAGEKVGGMTLPAFMVAFFDKDTKKDLGHRFGREVIGEEIGIQTDQAAEEGAALLITYNNDSDYYVRCSTPLARVHRLLKNADDIDEAQLMLEVLGSYVGRVPGVDELSPEEHAIQYRMVKSIVHLSVYMSAYPDSVSEGYPEQFNDYELPMRRPRPHVVGGLHFKGTHASPKGHWRSWHFRSYPRRKDGTKKAGLLPVRGTMVGPRETPHTVKEVT